MWDRDEIWVPVIAGLGVLLICVAALIRIHKGKWP